MTAGRTIAYGPDCALQTYHFQTIIIGSGAAGLNCAEHLHELGVQDVAIVTERLGAGTSANSGSDKQTYYKIGIFGDVPDSPVELARTLTAGGMCHGDLAYVEALGSAPEFFHLVRNGVEFPHNRYGAYVGYKTDHDPRQRATSAGPKTSIQMVERSLKRVRDAGVAIFDGYEVMKLLTEGEGAQKRVIGAAAIDKSALDGDNGGLVVFRAENVVLATGGPGELYAASVYPPGQTGSHGLALEIGCIANNLTESQFGIASTGFRWNLSGTYQQVMPCYFSIEAGADCHETCARRYFLNEYFATMRQEASAIFLKGYQWPFHAARLQDYGSSIIDLAVHRESEAGRKVYLDFTRNPVADLGLEGFALENLEPEARQYLENCGALQPTPYERLQHTNPAAIELYAEHETDLREPLEIAVCAQHNNGGLRGNLWWETNIRHLFAIGEINGSHGVRPGGSALNAGQVGGLRAAQYIAKVYNKSANNAPSEALAGQIYALKARLKRLACAPSADAPTVGQVRREIQCRMTREAGFLRCLCGARQALNEAREQWAALQQKGQRIASRAQLVTAIQNEHLCLTQIAFLTAIVAYLERGGGSRGGCVVLSENAELPGVLYMETKRGRELPHLPETMAMRAEILEISLQEDDEFEVKTIPVRPIPEDNAWYENTWREWKCGGIFAAQ